MAVYRFKSYYLRMLAYTIGKVAVNKTVSFDERVVCSIRTASVIRSHSTIASW